MSKNALNEASWQSPPAIFRGAPFWGWNAKLDAGRLRRQVEEMKKGGMGGFFMHSRYGLKTEYLSPEWFRCVKACIDKARELDMKACLYDEDRWASGTAAGLVTRKHPEYRQKFLIPVEADGPDPAEKLKTLAAFAVRLSGDRLSSFRKLPAGGKLSRGERRVRFELCRMKPTPWFNDSAYLDVMRPDAVAEFIRLGYEPYARNFRREFGGVVPAMFTDEIQLCCGHYPWTDRLPQEFLARRGYDLLPLLPELAYDPEDGFSKVRHDYFRTVSELFVESYSVQVGKWCERHNIALTGHCQGEPHLESQTRCVAATMPHYVHFQWPGMDVLRDRDNELSSCKQCSSVADQLGKERVLSETYGCTGWDWPLEGHRFNSGWQYALGVNFRCVHLAWYSMAGGGKRDCPASIFPHSPWWKYYRVVEDYFGRLSFMLTRGLPVRDVLLLHPVESAWGIWISQGTDPGSSILKMGKGVEELNTHYEGLVRALVEQHYDYDLGDEGLLAERGRVSGKGDRARLRVGRMEYRLVVVPPCHTLRKSTAKLLDQFIRAGGKVLFAGKPPARIDGGVSAGAEALVARAHRCATDPSVRIHAKDSCIEEIPPYSAGPVIAAMERLLPRRVSIAEGRAQCEPFWSLLRRVDGGQLLYVQSVDRENTRKARVSVEGHLPVVAWDAANGVRRRVDAVQRGPRVEFDLELPQRGAALFSLGLKVSGALPPEKPFKVARAVRAPGPWRISMSEANCLPLDSCSYRVGNSAWSKPMPVLLADEKLRAHFGLPKRDLDKCQPWYLAKTGRWDSKPRGKCELRFMFHITELPSELLLAVEEPANYRFVLNGREIPGRIDGWWVDEDIKTISIADFVRTGRNDLRLRFDFRSDMELEDLHLVGRFGVRRKGGRPVADAYTLVAPRTELKAGSWVGQGLDFYGGGLVYGVKVPETVRQAAAAGRRVRVSLPGGKGTCFAVHAGDSTQVLAWAPYAAEIGDALRAGVSEIGIEVIGGRHNSFGPLHTPWTPWMSWTTQGEFDPHHPQWTDEYLLNDHGLMAAPVFEVAQA